MKLIWTALRKALPDFLLILAGLLIAGGVWMIYPPQASSRPAFCLPSACIYLFWAKGVTIHEYKQRSPSRNRSLPYAEGNFDAVDGSGRADRLRL